MKKLFYILLAAGLFFGFTSCEDDEPVTDQPQTETPENGGEDDENGNNDPENPNPVEGDILVVYYSFTNNTHTIVTDLLTQIDADVVRVEPAEKGLDYAANNYAIGSALIAAIRENPNDASSYPAIDPVDVELELRYGDCSGTPLVEQYGGSVADLPVQPRKRDGREEHRIDCVQCQQRYQWGRSRRKAAYPGRKFPDPESLDTFFPNV